MKVIGPFKSIRVNWQQHNEDDNEKTHNINVRNSGNIHANIIDVITIQQSFKLQNITSEININKSSRNNDAS